MKKSEIKWHSTQPELGSEVVIFVNHVLPSFHFVKWQPGSLIDLEFDWDICISHGIYVGPHIFEGGGGFAEESKEKEYYWMKRQEFLDLVPLPSF